MNIGSRHSPARWYYYFTPLFILLDYVWGVNVRVTALDSRPMYKGLYYGFCIVCGVGMYIGPQYSAVVALFESTINFTMAILGLFLPYVQYVMYVDDVLSADWDAADAFTTERIANLLLAGFVSILVFNESVRTIGETFGHNLSKYQEIRRLDD